MQEREDFNARFHAVEKNNDDLRLGSCILILGCCNYQFFCLESTSHLELVKESYMNTMDELNRELLTMKEAYAQLDTEKQVLITELEKRPVQTDPEHVKQTIGMFSSSILDYKTTNICFRKSSIEHIETTVRRGLSRLILCTS
jgi:hypothetical protein